MKCVTMKYRWIVCVFVPHSESNGRKKGSTEVRWRSRGATQPEVGIGLTCLTLQDLQLRQHESEFGKQLSRFTENPKTHNLHFSPGSKPTLSLLLLHIWIKRDQTSRAVYAAMFQPEIMLITSSLPNSAPSPSLSTPLWNLLRQHCRPASPKPASRPPTQKNTAIQLALSVSWERNKNKSINFFHLIWTIIP